MICSLHQLNQIGVVLVLVYLPIVQARRAKEWHVSGVIKTRKIRVTGVNFSGI